MASCRIWNALRGLRLRDPRTRPESPGMFHHFYESILDIKNYAITGFPLHLLVLR